MKNKPYTTTYFVTAKIFELIGALLLVWCWIIYWPTIVMFLDIHLFADDNGFVVDLWTKDHIGMIVMGWFIAIMQIIVWVYQSLGNIGEWLLTILLWGGGILLVSIVGMMVCVGVGELIESWIRWNKDNLE